ncbi:MAG: response regulator [Spirochaetales bacterium]|nr:response regulator [Spirochaetales bacterium]
MKFLIAEDDFASRKLLQAYLKRAHLTEVDLVIDGQEAIQAFELAWAEEQPYDVIFLDIMMPNIDGQEALTTIRTRERELGVKPADEAKIIMVTALGDPTNVIRAFNKGGATGYLVKPIEPDTLMQEMKKYSII